MTTFVAARPGTAAEADDRQRALAAAGAVKIVVRGQGWIRVTQPELRAAGLRADVDPTTLQVFADGIEQAVAVTGNGDAIFAADEALELYGVGRDTLSTDARTYWLIAGTAGARVLRSTPPAGAAAPASFVRTARVADRKVYLAAIKNGEASNFYQATVSGAGVSPTFKVAAARVVMTQATLRVNLQGIAAGAHTVDVSFGGALAGTCGFADQEATTCTFPVTIAEGDNTVSLAARGGSKDFSAVRSVELDYAHAFTADDDTLTFPAPAGTRLAVGGFSSPDVRVVDVTDAARPVELAVQVAAQGQTNVATFDTPAGAGPRALLAFTGARVGKAAAVVADAPSHWGDSHDGELVILSHALFLDALAPLVARRTQEGWRVQVVDLQDVYDERGGGDKSVAAVRAFLQDAKARWRVPPRYVLVVGDATFDPRNFLNKGDFDFAPTKLIDTVEMETVSDDWMVDFNDDGVPDVSIGRFPVRTKDEAAVIIGKTLAYPGVADRPRGGLFVTDLNDKDLDFEGASAAAEAKVADVMPVDRFRRSDAAADPATLLAKLNEGPFLVNYLGHGSVEIWEGGLLTSAKAKALTNAHASLYVVMNCLNAFFHDLYTESLAEALMKAPQGGAVAVWASSTLSEFGPQPAFNQEFLSHLSRTSLGQTAMAAKTSITDLETRRTWVLLGDPTLFGTPGPAPDAGAIDPDPTDGGAPDGLTADAGAPEVMADAQAPEADAGTPDAGVADAAPMDAAPTDGAPTDAATDAARADAAGDAPKVTQAGGGCACRAEGTTPASASAAGLLVLACIAGARRRAGRRARGARRWPLALLALVLGGLLAPRAAEAAYGFRKTLTIDRTRIGAVGGATTLTDYPLLLTMTDTDLKAKTSGGDVEKALGWDIKFEGADAVTCNGPTTCTLAHEVEKWDGTTGEFIVWVRIPKLKTVTNTANTSIIMKYGDATVSAATQNVNGTWDTSFKGVWHLNQNPGGTAPQMTDSTSTGANGTATNGPTAASSAKISAGVTLDGTNDYFDYGTWTAFNYTAAETFTYEGWFLTSDSYGPLHSLRNAGGQPVIDIHIGYDGATNNAGKLMVLVRDDAGGTNSEVVASGTNVSNGAWHHYAVTRTGGTVTLYLDGASAGSTTNAGASSTITTTLRQWGRDGNWIASGYGTADQQYLAGSLDEFRVSKTLRSAEWIATDYNTQNTPASTFSAGAETLASCGDGTKLSGEGCDDGNVVSGDGCTSACTIESGYTCMGTTPSVCTTTCGDGIVAGTEGCDDGGTMNGNGCSSTCTVEQDYHCAGSPSVCTNGRFTYLKTITINKAQVGSAAGNSANTTLSNYPILVSVTDANLATSGATGHVLSSSGYDIIFRALDTSLCGGATACTLSHEIESYTASTGKLIAWVNIPVLNTRWNSGASTQIQILYRNQSITTSTERRTNTWGSTYGAVWHLHQNPSGTAPQMTDATINANSGTSVALATQASGKIGAGMTTNGTTSSMTFNSGSSLNSSSGGAFTYSTWIKVPTTEQFGAIVSSRSSTDGGNVVIDLMVGLNGGGTVTGGALMALLRDDTNGTYGQLIGGAINDNNWHLVTLTRNNNAVQMWMDVTNQGSGPVTATGVPGSYTTNLRDLGREGRWVQDMVNNPTTNSFLAADFDEARYSNVARDIDWITTDYNAQNAPGTFLTFGAETATTTRTDAMLSSFDAYEGCASTRLAWQTTFEVDTLGFNVFRDMGGVREQINTDLIPGSALSGGAAHTYELVDAVAAVPGRTYWLEIVHFDRASTFEGPIAAQRGASCDEPAGEPASRPTPAPLTGPGVTQTDDSPELAAGGCSVAGGSGAGLAALAALAALARARRRRIR